MRGVQTAAVLIAVAVLGTGCTAKSTATAGSQRSGVAVATQPSLDPKVQQACDDALKVINDSTTQMTDEVDKAVAAGDTGDTAGQSADIDQIRATFKDWSAALRAQADKATDPRFRSVLTQYAGAVEAVIANIKGPDDLEKLSSFDDSELDQVADSFGQLCD